MTVHPIGTAVMQAIELETTPRNGELQVSLPGAPAGARARVIVLYEPSAVGGTSIDGAASGEGPVRTVLQALLAGQDWPTREHEDIDAVLARERAGRE